MFWFGVLTIAITAVFTLFGVFHWIFTAPEMEQSAARNRFRAEQDYRAARRSGKLTPR